MTSSAAVVNCPVEGGAVSARLPAAGASHASPATTRASSGISFSRVSTPSERTACLMPVTLIQARPPTITVSSAMRTQLVAAAGHRYASDSISRFRLAA